MTADQVEANGEWFGDTQPGEVIDLHPVAEDVACGRCRHPRWMHGGERMNGPCHRTTWLESSLPPRPKTCACLNFIEPDGRNKE